MGKVKGQWFGSNFWRSVENKNKNFGDFPTSSTGNFLSEALILASINPKHDDGLFVELWVQYEKTTS